MEIKCLLASWKNRCLAAKSFSVAGALMLTATAGSLLSGGRAIAADEVLLKYGPIRQSVSLQDLQTLANTGEQSSTLRTLFGQTNTDPEEVRGILNEEVNVNVRFIDRVLNSQIGELLLSQIAKVINTGVGTADIQALRSAFILSAQDDNRLTLLEILENFPGSRIEVEGNEIASVVEDVVLVGERLEGVVNFVGNLLEDLICECGTASTSTEEMMPAANAASTSESMPALSQNQKKCEESATNINR